MSLFNDLYLGSWKTRIAMFHQMTFERYLPLTNLILVSTGITYRLIYLIMAVICFQWNLLLGYCKNTYYLLFTSLPSFFPGSANVNMIRHFRVSPITSPGGLPNYVIFVCLQSPLFNIIRHETPSNHHGDGGKCFNAWK